MNAPLFTFDVPLDWAGEPFGKDSIATAWMTADGERTEVAAEAVVFRARLFASMADRIKVERRLDEVNGGIGETVDLDMGIEQVTRRLRAQVSADLWPDGRPETSDPEEKKTQERLLNVAFYADPYQKDRMVLQRMTALRDRQMMAAEWPILIVDPPEGWADVAKVPLPPGFAEQIARAYLHRKGVAEHAAVKRPRSEP
jgi:hypothetical protein